MCLVYVPDQGELDMSLIWQTQLFCWAALLLGCLTAGMRYSWMQSCTGFSCMLRKGKQ